MNKIVLLAGLLLLCLGIHTDVLAQDGFCDFNTPENTYRTIQNPNYWMFRKPYEGYWQQDVHYKIKANIDESTDIIDGEEILTYYNNSPDTLHFLFFHLYQNAFQPESYASELSRVNHVVEKYGRYEKEKKGTVIDYILYDNMSEQYDGLNLRVELDNTIMKVDLPEGLAPHKSVRLKIKFKTYFDKGTMRRRFKKFDASGNTHYDGVHWYPRVSVYDKKNAWDTNQHLGKEFYGDFGTYDVALTFSSNYVVEATGVLQNENEVMPADLRERLDIKNFYNKPWNSPATVITPYRKYDRKTWIYHAENVHDFAFTADPTYRIDTKEWNGIKCISLVQEPHASGWKNAAYYTARVIETYSRDFGMYLYPKMIVADAQDGMEYPMLTLDGGSDPSYRSLLAHEIGHNWFYGMIGNNETYRAFLDEGFTQFLTSWSQERIDGLEVIQPSSKSSYVNYFKKPDLVREKSVLRPYLQDAMKGDAPPLNIHSDYYESALGHGGGYRHVYMKTATMLYNLEYTLGEDLFLDAMKHYFDKWKLCHPYEEDFKESITEYVGYDMSWFFDQWINTDKTIDYSVKNVHKAGFGDYKITLERKGEMQMPLDITIIDKNGTEHEYYIPNTHFQKNTKATKLPKWEAWDKLYPTYSFIASIPYGIKDVIIDPSNRLADVNPINNHKKCNTETKFDSKIYNASNINQYEVKWRPDIWYNDPDGIKLGFHLDGNYMNYRRQFSLTAWYNSRVVAGSNEKTFADETWKDVLQKWNFNFSYETPLTKIDKHTFFQLDARRLDGLYLGRIGLEKAMKSGDLVGIHIKSMYRQNNTDLEYLIYKQFWNADQWNNSLNLSYYHPYQYVKGKGGIQLDLRTPFFKSDYDYTSIKLEAKNTNYLKKLVLKTRTFGQYLSGSNIAPESALYTWGANPEEMMENKYVRSRAFFNPNHYAISTSTNHFQYGGGLNLRGYAGYTMVEQDKHDNQLHYIWNPNLALAENMELEFDQIFKFHPKKLSNYFKLNTYLFADAALITYRNSLDELRLASPRIDAGIGASLTIKKFFMLETIKPLTIRFDMPLFLNHPPYSDQKYVSASRWVLSINRAF